MTPTQKGRRGGLLRARKLSPGRRREIARRAALARWKKRDPREILKNKTAIAAFCRKYDLHALFVFGSVLTASFDPKSDVDLLYVPGARPLGYVDYINAIEDLERLFGRRVDFVNKDVIDRSSNEFRRRAILESAEKVYEAH